MAENLRIPFSIAISEPKLLKARFDQLSLPQQVALKGMYGCELSAEKKDDRGWSEIDYWQMLQGHAEYDELGYLKRIVPGGPTYSPGTEWPEATAVIGVRGGKTEVAAFIAAYEAVCGGHEAYIRKGKRAVVFVIAQDLRFARFSLPGILANLESIPLMEARTKRSKIVRQTADSIDLWNGVRISVVPPSVKAVRGYDAPVAIMDEVGVWSQETESANPDFEVYRMIHSRQATFPYRKIFLISSPWVKQGLLYERYEAGTDGSKIFCPACLNTPTPGCRRCDSARTLYRNQLLLHTTTAAFGNPQITKSWLQSAKQDPRAFERESLAQFVDAIAGFLDATLIQEATDFGVYERTPNPEAFYVAAIDPAFRQDAFGLCIAHIDKGGAVVVDYLRRWAADDATQPLNPSVVLDEIAEILKNYRVLEVVSDQYHIDTLQQLALLRGFGIRQVTFTGSAKAQMYGNLQQLLRQRKLKLIDHEETLRELRSIERRNMPGGTVRIAAPKGAHDDMATVVALAAHQCMWLAPIEEAPVPKPETPFEIITKQIARNKRPVYAEY